MADAAALIDSFVFKLFMGSSRLCLVVKIFLFIIAADVFQIENLKIKL